MSDSVLKKEFQKKDVERLRNLIRGNYGDSTQTLVGYEKEYQEHTEGDVWEEDGKQWTIQDGIRLSIPKLQKARDLAKLPYTCPKCGKPLSTRLDRKMYPIHHMCFDCVTKFEDSLKRAGLYEAYEREMINGNVKSFVAHLKDMVEAVKSDTQNTFVTEDGVQEDWGKISKIITDGLDEWVTLLTEKIQ